MPFSDGSSPVFPARAVLSAPFRGLRKGRKITRRAGAADRVLQFTGRASCIFNFPARSSGLSSSFCQAPAFVSAAGRAGSW